MFGSLDGSRIRRASHRSRENISFYVLLYAFTPLLCSTAFNFAGTPYLSLLYVEVVIFLFFGYHCKVTLKKFSVSFMTRGLGICWVSVHSVNGAFLVPWDNCDRQPW